MRKGLSCLLLAAVLGLILPAGAAACEGCKLYRVCLGDNCWWTSICGSTNYPNAGWTECDDSTQPCTYAGERCHWVAVPELKKAPDAPPASS